jgi:hypothetical protein
MCQCSCDVHLSELVRLFMFIQVQQENLLQAEELAAQATQIAAVKTDLQDTQKLLSALQSMNTALGHNCQLHQITNLMLHAKLVLLDLHTECFQNLFHLMEPSAGLQVCLQSSLRW